MAGQLSFKFMPGNRRITPAHRYPALRHPTYLYRVRLILACLEPYSPQEHTFDLGKAQPGTSSTPTHEPFAIITCSTMGSRYRARTARTSRISRSKEAENCWRYISSLLSDTAN